MNLEYLKTFYITVKSNSISKAARLLHMSQPGVSIQLQALEKELNVKLLLRSNKGVELTDAGQIVYDYAVSILSIQENVERQLDAFKRQKTELIVSSCTTVGCYALPCTLYLFKENFPQVNVLLNITNSNNVVSNILNGISKIGLIEGKTSCPELLQTKITSDNLKLVASPDVFHINRVTGGEFLKLPLILREEGSGTRDVIVSTLERHDINIQQANIVMELSSSEAIKSAVIGGKGISILSQLAIKKELATGVLKEIQLADLSFAADYYIIQDSNICPKSVEKSFTEFILSSKRGFC
ncbi:MAG: LysR family transcriptional regulator [Clostridiaceae bacterium BRH_c20a]|nr:MAG: LysR family transcriptional regulator [Clostridiaceae bacterium BRH_c20a]